MIIPSSDATLWLGKTCNEINVIIIILVPSQRFWLKVAEQVVRELRARMTCHSLRLTCITRTCFTLLCTRLYIFDKWDNNWIPIVSNFATTFSILLAESTKSTKTFSSLFFNDQSLVPVAGYDQISKFTTRDNCPLDFCILKNTVNIHVPKNKNFKITRPD